MIAPAFDAFASRCRQRAPLARPAPSRASGFLNQSSMKTPSASGDSQRRIGRSRGPLQRSERADIPWCSFRHMRFVHSSIAPRYACCTAAIRPISGVPSLGVSSLDLGPHGNPVAALFFARPRITRPRINLGSVRFRTRPPAPGRAELPKTATKMSRAHALSMSQKRIRAPALVRPQSPTYLGGAPHGAFPP